MGAEEIYSTLQSEEELKRITQTQATGNKRQLPTEAETLLWLMTYLMPENTEEISAESWNRDNEFTIHVIIT